ncbi:MAG: tRNA (adenosine(37)-N6)-dimethylallyltransferase MiaA [Minisyncoccia bacterium]
MKKKVLVILGPTASGKSSLAVKLAKKFKGEIISADSRQVYRGLNVGTGKITKKEMRGVPHHMLDVADPRKQFSVSEYKKLATNSLQYIITKNKLPIVVGGTGFYIDTLTGAISLPEVPPNKKLREKLDKKSALELFKILEKKDPKRARAIGQHNKVRLIRALEIVETLGQVPPLFAHSRELAYRYIFIGLKPDDLDKRIHQRLIKRLEPMIAEAKKLIKNRAISYRRMDQLGLEYRYIGMYLEGKISREVMVDELYRAIRQYAKRQMTWFKRNKKIKWFEPREFGRIEKYLSKIL